MQVFWNARIKAVEAVIDLYKSLHKLLIDIQSFLYMSAVENPSSCGWYWLEDLKALNKCS